MRHKHASHEAKKLLSHASRHLLTPDPTQLPDMSRALDQSLDWSLDQRHDPDAFGSTFSETRASALGFQVEPGGRGANHADQTELSTAATRSVIAADMGPDAAHWFDARTEPMRARYRTFNAGFGANFATAVDHHGVVEAAATYGWGPDMTAHFPDTIVQMATTAQQALPALVPFFTTIRCGRSAGGQQITFDISRETSFDELRALMAAFGLENRHAGLMTLGAFTLGARYKLPARSSTLTLLRSGTQIEMRLDINLDALPDAPQVLLPLLRLPMAERPAAQASFDRWLTALTPDGYSGPGSVTVLSIRVRHDMPARLALFLRPVGFEQPQEGVEITPELESAAAGEFSAEQMPDWRAYR
ncbi:hypothetical protein [Yoonia sp.]|uniref:hypothetical protein n=1 Tax=Yoonia sp. TaxID=2212373 RepID=UPI00358F1658